MVPRTPRIVTGILALLAVVGFTRCSHHPRPTVGFTLHPVTINQNSQANPSDTYLYISNADTVAWVPYAANHPLKITFHHEMYPAIANGEPPFAGGTTGADQIFSSTNGTIYSPAINPKLKAVFDGNPGVTVLIYLFDQKVDGVEKDGRIIIMK